MYASFFNLVWGQHAGIKKMVACGFQKKFPDHRKRKLNTLIIKALKFVKKLKKIKCLLNQGYRKRNDYKAYVH